MVKYRSGKVGRTGGRLRLGDKGGNAGRNSMAESFRTVAAGDHGRNLRPKLAHRDLVDQIAQRGPRAGDKDSQPQSIGHFRHSVNRRGAETQRENDKLCAELLLSVSATPRFKT